MLQCDGSTTLLEAAEDAGLMLKASCESGGCGACSAVLRDGRVEMGDHDPNVIEVPEGQGGILLCRSFPRGIAGSSCRTTRAQSSSVRRCGTMRRSPRWTGWPTA